ncbi:hypothetical protein B5M09_002717 [Aphanomyces astaci]|uniref:Carboxypeptidase n=1 Tax=Aphanomyces astaci TaxID=112090 RepID=A0A425CRP4_APHAT|nr:hypothetical protein B5M09_002717 [Aphanomyces astaci]
MDAHLRQPQQTTSYQALPLHAPHGDAVDIRERSKWPWWSLLLALAGCIGVGFTAQATVFATPSLSSTRVEPLCDASVRQLSGYLQVTNATKYFYWYFESRDNPTKDPLVLWLNGGPGASSLIGLLAENGPCLLDPDTLTLKDNPHAWNAHANVIWLDQPANVGFSQGPPTPPSQVGPNVHTFLENFLAQHPELHRRRLYLTGESYAGHYIPGIAHTILQGNAVKPSSEALNLQGILIVNGLTNVQVQVAQHELDMVFENAYNVTLVPNDQLSVVKTMQTTAVDLARTCQHDSSVCPNATLAFIALQSQVNEYTTRDSLDIRQDCNVSSCSAKMTAIDAFLSQARVQTRLGVHPYHPSYSVSNGNVMTDFATDIATNYAPYVDTVLNAKVPVVLVAGDADLQCNWRGVQAWPEHLHWHGAHGYKSAPLQPHFIDHVQVNQPTLTVIS